MHNSYLGKNFNFYSNLLLKSSLIHNFPSLLSRNILQLVQTSFFPVSVTSTIMSQLSWFNEYILIEKQSFLFPTMSNSGLNYVGQLFDNNEEIKDWNTIKLQCNLEDKFYFSWLQLFGSITVSWKINFMDGRGNSINLCIFECHLIKKESKLCNSQVK